MGVTIQLNQESLTVGKKRYDSVTVSKKDGVYTIVAFTRVPSGNRRTTTKAKHVYFEGIPLQKPYMSIVSKQDYHATNLRGNYINYYIY